MGDPGASTQALLIGDSHARAFRPFVDVLARDAHVKVYGLTNSACPTLEGSADRAGPDRRVGCVAGTTRDFALIRSGRFRYVVFAERWIGYPPDALAGLAHSLQVVIDAGATPIVFAPVAEDGTNKYACFWHHVKIRAAFTEDCAIRQDSPFAAAGRRSAATLIADMQRQYPMLVVIDPQAAQCRDGICPTVIDDTPGYIDEHHLSAFGATMLGRDYLARFGNPLRPPSPR
jgi:SGNH domain (fused to AT3 domains)